MPEHFCKTVIVSMISTQSWFVHGQQATCLRVRLMKPSFLIAIEDFEVTLLLETSEANEHSCGLFCLASPFVPIFSVLNS